MMPVYKRVLYALEICPMTAYELVDLLKCHLNSIYNAVNWLASMGYIRCDRRLNGGGHPSYVWSLA
jgi:hypothetical protein